MLEDPKYRAKFPVTLSAPATAPCSAAYELVAGTAQPDVDYSPATGSLEFAVGEDTKEIVVDVREIYLGDPAAFKLRVTSPQGLTFARAEGDALIPGKSLHDLLHDTFTGANGSLFGHEPEIGGAWEDREETGAEVGPQLVSGMADFGKPWTDFPSGYVAPIVPVLSGAGTLSLKVKIDSFVVDPAPEANASSVSISMFRWDGPAASCELAFDLRTQTLRINGTGVVTPFDYAYTFPTGAPFEIELRYELETGWVGVYVDGVWIYSQLGTPDDGSFGGMDTVNIYTHGFTSLLFDELRVTQGGPGTTHEQVVTPVPEGYLADTFFGTGSLSNHNPEYGVARWEAWNANSPILDGNGALTFLESSEEISCDGMAGGGISVNAPTRVFVETKTLPAQGRFTFGLADSPTIGQSLTGAQVELDFDRQIASLISASATTEFPFPADWATSGPLNPSLYLGSGSDVAIVRFGDTYVGGIHLESAVGDMSNFKFFFRAENTPQLELDRIILVQTGSYDLVIPETVTNLFVDTFSATDGLLYSHLPDTGTAWEDGDGIGANAPTVVDGVVQWGKPWSQYPSGYGKFASAATTEGGTLSYKFRIESYELDAAHPTGEAVMYMEVFDDTYVGAGPNLTMDLRRNYITAAAPGTVTTNWTYDFSGLTSFDFELRYELETGWVGVYINDEWIYSRQGTPNQLGGANSLYIYMHGLTGLVFDNITVKQGGPDTVHEEAEVPPPLPTVYLNDTLTGSGTLVGHVPEKGSAWQSWEGTAPSLDTGLMDFSASGGTTLQAQVPAGITGSISRTQVMMPSGPTAGQLVIGLADAPMNGQSYSGAQLDLDFAARTLTIVGTYSSTTFPFPDGWASVSPVTIKMILGNNNASVLAYLGGQFVGIAQLESVISSQNNFKFFVAGSSTDAFIDRVLIEPGDAEEMNVPPGEAIVVRDTFTAADLTPISSHVGEVNARWTMLYGDEPQSVFISNNRLRRPTYVEDMANAGGERKFYLSSARLISGLGPGIKIEFDLIRHAIAYQYDFIALYKNGDNYGNADLLAQIGYNDVTTPGATTALPFPIQQNSTHRVKIKIEDANMEVYVDGSLIVSEVLGEEMSSFLAISMFDSGDATPSFSIDNFQVKGYAQLVAAPSTLPINDTFTDVNGTYVYDHTGESGVKWLMTQAAHDAATGDGFGLKVVNNALLTQGYYGNQRNVIPDATVPADTPYFVEFGVTFAAGTGNQANLTVYQAAGTTDNDINNASWMCQLVHSNSAGIGFFLGNVVQSSNLSMPDGTPQVVRCEFNGTNLVIKLNGAVVLTDNDAMYASLPGGHVGFAIEDPIAGGQMPLDYWKVEVLPVPLIRDNFTGAGVLTGRTPDVVSTGAYQDDTWYLGDAGGSGTIAAIEGGRLVTNSDGGAHWGFGAFLPLPGNPMDVYVETQMRFNTESGNTGFNAQLGLRRPGPSASGGVFIDFTKTDATTVTATFAASGTPARSYPDWGDFTVPDADNFVVRVEARGTELKLFLNGVVVLTVTLNAPSPAGGGVWIAGAPATFEYLEAGLLT